MKYFLGLDISLTSTGVCVINEKGKVCIITHITSENIGNDVSGRMLRIKNVGKEVLAALGKNIIMCTAIEAYSFASKGKLAQLVEIGSHIRFKIYSFTPSVIIEPVPIQLKKFILGPQLMKKAKGKEAKTIIIREIYKKYCLDINNDDEADAFILANIALLYYNIRNNVKSKHFTYQREVIEALIKKEDNEWKKRSKSKT